VDPGRHLNRLLAEALAVADHHPRPGTGRTGADDPDR
jgi:hypothetical protein